MTRNVGPLSSYFPVHVTSISRCAPLPMQGSVSVPGPAESFRQSERGGGGVVAVTVGAGALAEGAGVDAAAADVAALCAVVDPDGLGSEEQPKTAGARDATMNALDRCDKIDM